MTRKTAFFQGWSWFKFNNLRLALGMNLKFYTSLAKGLKLKVRKFCGLIHTFAEFTAEKLEGGLFASPSWIGLSLYRKLWACNKTAKFQANSKSTLKLSQNEQVGDYLSVCVLNILLKISSLPSLFAINLMQVEI